tara:strand:- start:339 stop:1001 length:663 start_codon:yes stop_codon:yes gene_type:complete
MIFANRLKEAALKNPHLDWPNLSYYLEDNKKLLSSSSFEERIIFMGDSITEEWEKLYPEFFQNKFSINRGIGGQTTPQMLVRFRQDVIGLNPKAVFILAGTNDIAGNTGPSSTEMIANNIFSMAELAINHGIKTILSSILPVYKYPWAEHIENVPEAIKDVNLQLEKFCDAKDLLYLDYYSSMVNEKCGLKNEYTTDGVHLNKAGYEVMSNLVFEILKII